MVILNDLDVKVCWHRYVINSKKIIQRREVNLAAEVLRNLESVDKKNQTQIKE